MQRMHSFALLTLVIVVLAPSSSTAALLRPNDSREYPDITAFANGSQTYHYDTASQTGTFQLANSPFLLTMGQSSTGTFSEFNVTPTSTGVLSQTLTAILDSNGNLVNNASNSFQVYGTVVVNGQTYSGLLLAGTPTAFGSQTLKPSVGNEDLFDLTLHITGGSMADLYGQNAYMRVTAEANSTFDGVFTTDFSSEKILTNTHTLASLLPQAAPEPTTLYVLLACGAALFYRGRRRISANDLQV